MIHFYQHLPEMANPVALSLGNFSIRWYSIMYLAGFLIVYLLLTYRIKKREYLIQNQNYNDDLIFDFLVYSFFGLLIGARLGYEIFYNLDYFIRNPLTIISPFDAGGNFVGIFGMSYFGGLIGIIAATWIFCRRNKINIWKWSDFVIPAIPAGYFFGRLGNFLNGELYGKITNSWIGMYFPADRFQLRYPTQLFEALLEGILLFAILWFFRNKYMFSGRLFCFYLIGYGIIRFFVEFLRETDPSQFWGILNTSQLLALAAIAFGSIFCFRNKLK